MALDENMNQSSHLVELNGSDFEIRDGEPNIEGWDVKNEHGQKIGEVDDMLFDTSSLKVRYLIVDLDGNDLNVDDKKVLIPIGVAELYGAENGTDVDEVDSLDTDAKTINEPQIPGELGSNHLANSNYGSNVINETDADEEAATTEAGVGSHHGVYNPSHDGEVVIVPVTVEQLNELPAYEKGGVNADMEAAIRRIFEGAGVAEAAAYSTEGFYDHDHFNENKFYDRDYKAGTSLPVIEENLEIGKREVETGGARLTSRIVETPVKENINLREEHVTVERTPVDRPISSSDVNAFKEEEFEMTEHAEVPVVTKEARVVEEVSLNKEVEEREETIRETLRNTEVEAERIDPKKKDTL